MTTPKREQISSNSDIHDDISVALRDNLMSFFHHWMVLQRKLIRKQNLKMPQLFILRYLYYNKPKDLSSLAESLGVSKPTVTGIISTLVKDGYIKRKHDRKDRRKIDVVPTQKTLDLFASVDESSRMVVENFVKLIPEDMVFSLNSAISNIATRLEEMDVEVGSNLGECNSNE